MARDYRQMQRSSDGGPSNRAILDSIAALSRKVDTVDSKVDKFDIKFDQLAELFIPRRELNETLGAMKDRTADHHSRLAALEQQQLNDMQRRTEERLAAQQQVASSEQKQAMSREELLRLGATMLGQAVIALIIFILGNIITHR